MCSLLKFYDRTGVGWKSTLQMFIENPLPKLLVL